jgi:lipoprotein NlpI
MLFNRGTVSEALGHWQAAIADFDEVLAIDPEEPDSLLHRAACIGSVRRSGGLDG